MCCKKGAKQGENHNFLQNVKKLVLIAFGQKFVRVKVRVWREKIKKLCLYLKTNCFPDRNAY